MMAAGEQGFAVERALAPLGKLLEEESVTEIMVVGHDRIWIERQGRLEWTGLSFPDAIALEGVARSIARFVGRRFDERCPQLDGRLPDGSRVHLIGPPASREGICLTLRRSPKGGWSMLDLVANGMMPESAATWLVSAVAGGANLLVSGGTGSGKTTLLAALAGCFPPGERIIVIEDAAELRIARPHVVRLETVTGESTGGKPLGLDGLLRGALRMRPDRLIVGEVRGPEAVTLVQATTTGHRGCMGTVHAGSWSEALARIEVLCLLGGFNLPRDLLAEQIRRGFDLVVQVERSSDGQRRVVEIVSLPEEGERPHTVYRWTAEAPSACSALGEDPLEV